MAKVPTLTVPVTFEVDFTGNPEVLEATYRMHYAGSGREVINELRSNAAHCLALADMIERDAEEKKTSEVAQLAELLHGVGSPDSAAKSCDSCYGMAHELITRGVKVGN